MGRYVRNFLILLTISLLLFAISLEISLAEQYFKYVGNVVDVHKGTMSVKGDKGEVMHFAVGKKTIYIPHRVPAIGERVRVTYFFRKGNYIGSQIEILPSSSPPRKK